jgi:hypothetical protein
MNTKRPPPPPPTRSGLHPAVTKFRKKIDSIVDGTAEDLADLDRKLSRYLEESERPPPPPDASPPSDR